MNRIKEKRIEQGLTQPELAKCINRDAPMISKFENFVCLPIPEDANKLAKKLKCTTILELYDEEDLRFINQEQSRPKKKRDPIELLVYRLTADLPREAIEWLIKDNLQLLGYSSIRDWANDCFKKFKQRVQKKKSHLDCNQNDSKNRMLS